MCPEPSDVAAESPSSAVPHEAAGGKEALAHSHIAELDGFRAIAILWVFLLHMFYGWGPRPPQGFTLLPGPFIQIASHGWLGVDLFFILSGFLITGILLDSREKPNYFRNFYARRVLRIVPLYFTCIAIMAIFYRGFHQYFLLSLVFFANFARLFDIRIPGGPSSYWSLAIEEHFYLLWPLLVRFLNRSYLFALTLIIVFGTPILRGVAAYKGVDPNHAIYFYSWFRFDGLALGAILAMWMRSPYFDRKWVWKLAGFLLGFSLAATIIGLPFGIMGTRTPVAAALRYTQMQFVFAAFMALALAYRGTKYTTLLRTRFTKTIAGLSYCIYLIHEPIGDGYYAILHRTGFSDVAHFGYEGTVAVRFFVIASLSFVIASLSKKYLEDPMLRLKRYF